MMSRTMKPHTTHTAMRRSSAAMTNTPSGKIGLPDAPHQLPVEREEVADLGELPGDERSPARPGQHRQRQQPQHVLLGPYLREDQESRHGQERKLAEARAAGCVVHHERDRHHGQTEAAGS